MFFNIVIYSLSLKNIDHTLPDTNPLTKSLGRLHLVLMCFFLTGYLAVLYFFLTDIEFASSLFVSVIFFFGAIFVFLGIVVQRRMVSSLNSFNADLKQSNKDLKKEQQALLQLNTQLQDEIQTRIKAEKSDQLKSNLLSLVSHELRTPLTSIYGFTKLLQKGMSSLSPEDNLKKHTAKKERLENNIDIICSECSRLTRLVNNFLDLAKIESGKFVWNDDRYEMAELIDKVVSAVEGLLLEKPSVTFKTDIPEALPTVYVDADRFSQVLINIINNAIKFTDAGVVEMSITVADEKVQIIVRDEGVGINSKDIPHIFDEFYIVRSGDTLGGNQVGTGLGLPICKQIIEHYSGRIWVESEPGEGASFFIELPLNVA